MLFSLTLAVTAFSVDSVPRGALAPRAAIVRMFDDAPKGPKADEVSITSVTRSREVGAGRSGKIVVTDGSGSFYGSRTIFQQLHDFGRYASIVASSESTADSKKMLLSRSARYSGLLDVLGFHEGTPNDAFAGADTWLAIDPSESTLESQISAAAAAGITRIFVLTSEAVTDSAALEAQLSASGVEYTVMRTGALIDGEVTGSGLKLDEFDMAVCEDVPKADVFRFVTEALTLPEANGRTFSLCPSEGVVSTLKQMRVAGYERRDEVKLLLTGVVKEPEAETELTEEEQAAEAELVLRSEAEVAAEREEELKMLLEKARKKGIETQERLAREAAEKEAKREELKQRAAELSAKFSTPGDDAGDDAPPPKTPDTPPAP